MFYVRISYDVSFADHFTPERLLLLNRDISCVTYKDFKSNQKVLFSLPSLCRVRGYVLGANTVYLEAVIYNEVEPLCVLVPRIFHPSTIRLKCLYNSQHVTDRFHSILL